MPRSPAYVGSWDGYEYAVSTATGKLIWKTFLGLTTDPACNPHVIGSGGWRR